MDSKHANFLVNTGRASAADFLSLMELVQETVSKRFGIDLERQHGVDSFALQLGIVAQEARQTLLRIADDERDAGEH